MSATTFCSVELVALTCSECDCVFAVPGAMERRRREDGKTFYCPNGHPQCFGEAPLKRLERELAQERARADQARAAERQARAQRDGARADLESLRKRVGAGVCPCCNRSFEDLRRHMATEHPERAPPKDASEGITAEPRLKCPHCPMDFKAAGWLDRHVRARHGGTVPSPPPEG